VKIKSSIVVAAAAGSAVAPNAKAADIPVKAPKMVAAPAWNWTGFYVGGHLGAAWQDPRATGSYVDDAANRITVTNAAKSTGFIGGAQIGYNWQTGIFVYGVEADISDLSSSGRVGQTAVAPNDPDAFLTSSSETKWLGTVRGRLGVTFFGGRTLAYATGGWAYGHVVNTHTEVVAAAGNLTATWVESSNRSGYAVGGGIEHMLTPNWTVRVEGLYVDLGDKTLLTPNTGTCVNVCDPVVFSNKMTTVRAGINYKF
jgi:outer membrane immunogenic protein